MGLGLKNLILTKCAQKYGWTAATYIGGGYTLGAFATAFSFAIHVYTVINIITYLDNAYWSNLQNNGYGNLSIQYAISYHGSWYQTNTNTRWSTVATVTNRYYVTDNTVYLPASYYGGNGTDGFIPYSNPQ